MNQSKKALGLFSMMAAMAAMGDVKYSKHSSYQDLTDEEKKDLELSLKAKRAETLKQRGVKEFFYGDNVIFARNKKNADRKAKNKGYL